MSLRLSHAELAGFLSRAGAEQDAAEVHGLATGLLASDVGSDRLVAEILPQVSESDLPAAECQAALQRLAAETRTALTDETFRFMPLLPDDNASLRERSASLRDWCEGFLYGLGLGLGSNVSRALPPDVTEALEDIGELTRLNIADVGEAETEEEAYAELVEFIRVATLLIRDGLSPHAAEGLAHDE